MGRFLFAALLITNLLVCPLRCFSCQTGSIGEGCVIESTCGCCADATVGVPGSPEKSPEQHQCACPSCICEGATLQDAPEVPPADALIALESWPVDAAAVTAPRVALISASPESSDSPPAAPAGRVALIAYRCWLN